MGWNGTDGVSASYVAEVTHEAADAGGWGCSGRDGIGAGDSRGLWAVRSSDSYKRALATVYEQHELSLSTHCPTIHLDMAHSTAVVEGPFETDGKGDLMTAHWKETTSGTACGETRLYNGSVVIQAGTPRVVPLFPGHSLAGPQLQHDAVPFAAIASKAAGGCPVDVLNTELMSDKVPGPREPWVERWTVQVCGKRSEVLLHFLPDATGTTIQANAAETTAVE